MMHVATETLVAINLASFARPGSPEDGRTAPNMTTHPVQEIERDLPGTDENVRTFVDDVVAKERSSKKLSADLRICDNIIDIIQRLSSFSPQESFELILILMLVLC